jgi:hypothetical protein
MAESSARFNLPEKMPHIWPQVSEILLGALLLVVSTLVHGFGMYLVQRHFDRHWPTNPAARARRQFVFGSLILLMLCTHLFEVLLWAITLVLTDAVQDFRDAFYYSSVTYTTLGYEDIVLPHNWRLLAPMIAMSGVFAFGWTTGVIVNLVAQSHASTRKESR